MRYTLLILLAILLAFASTMHATDLRGRVDGLSPTGLLAGVSVALFTESNGRFTLVRQTVTGPDGMYYFTTVSPGQYVLQVGGVNYPLAVEEKLTQDIQAIRR